MMENSRTRFVTKALLLSVMFYAASLGLSFLFTRTVDWKAQQDPRRRILYEKVPADCGIILLGDSVWTSEFAKSEDEAIWRILQELTGQCVFNATLAGADSPDFFKAVELLPKKKEKEALVFLDATPTRFVARTSGELPNGNYAKDFANLTGSNLVRSAFAFLRKPLVVLNAEFVLNTILRPKYFSVGDSRPRVWSKDGDYALKIFRTFERYLDPAGALRRIDWLAELKQRISSRGYRLVVVITPVNEFLIREYSNPEKVTAYELRFRRVHEALVRFLDENRIDYLDCFGEGDSEGFVDLIHTNARGDRPIAKRMAGYYLAWMASNREKDTGRSQ